MQTPPVPQRVPPLAWRKPAFIWTPLALAAAIAWPLPLFRDDPGPQRLSLLALFATFAVTLISLGISWALAKPPKTRRVVVVHVVLATLVVALLGPYFVSSLIKAGAIAPLAATPIVIMLGLPIALVSGLIFAVLALGPGQLGDDGDVLEDKVFSLDAEPLN
jgi:hypothetical protein